MYLKLTEPEIKTFIAKYGHRDLIVSDGEKFHHDNTSNVYELDEISEELDTILSSFFADDVTLEITQEQIEGNEIVFLCQGESDNKYFLKKASGGVYSSSSKSYLRGYKKVLEITKPVFTQWCEKHLK